MRHESGPWTLAATHCIRKEKLIAILKNYSEQLWFPLNEIHQPQLSHTSLLLTLRPRDLAAALSACPPTGGGSSAPVDPPLVSVPPPSPSLSGSVCIIYSVCMCMCVYVVYMCVVCVKI